MSVEFMTLLMFGSLIALLILGIPIAWALGGVALFTTLLLWDFNSLYLFITSTYGTMVRTSFIAIPLFICMGVLMQLSGIADGLFHTMYIWSGRLRGGIAIGVVIICAIFAAMTGISGAAAVTMGLIAIPAMRKHGYDKDLAVGTVAGPSTLGILIPPSIVMIQMAIIAEISAGQLFFAGMGPGIVMALMFIVYIVIKGLINPSSCPATTVETSWKEKIASLRTVILPSLTIVAVLGSIFFGIATPTEASGVGVLALLIILIIHRRFNWQTIRQASTDSFRISALNMWIIFGAIAFASVYTALGGIQFVNGILLGLELGRWGTLMLIMGIVFIMGMFIDPIAIIWIVCPLAFPLMEKLGFDSIWFGTLFVINIVMSYITPPFGCNLFYMKAIAPPDISMRDIFRSIWPFLGVEAACFAVVAIFPQTALWLPGLMRRMRA